MTTPGNAPTSTVTALAWLRHMLRAEVAVARALPAEEDVTPQMREYGIVVARVVGGGVDIDVPMREPVMGVECWVPPPAPESDIVPVNRAERLGNWVFDAANAHPVTGLVLYPAAAGLGSYRRVWVRTVVPRSEPREIPNDRSNYARFDIDMQFHWTET